MLSELSLPLKISLGALIGGFISLDYVAVAQLMVSMPLVVAPVLGWLLGSFKVGLALGVAFQLLWFVDSAFGAHIPPDGSAGAQISVIGVLGAIPTGDVPLWALSISALVAIPFAMFSSLAEGWVRKGNSILGSWVIASLSAGRNLKHIPKLRSATILGVLILYVKSVLVILVGSVVCCFALKYFGQWNPPEKVLLGLSRGWYLLPAVGIGTAVRYFSTQKKYLILALVGLSLSLVYLVVLGGY